MVTTPAVEFQMGNADKSVLHATGKKAISHHFAVLHSH